MSNQTEECIYCGKEVATNAKKCQHCGGKGPRQRRGEYGCLIFLAIMAAIIIGSILSV